MDELSPEVESFEQGVAFVTWCLEPGRRWHIRATRATIRSAMARRGTAASPYSLPWERQRAGLCRPTHIASFSATWARLALKMLAEHVATVR